MKKHLIWAGTILALSSAVLMAQDGRRRAAGTGTVVPVFYFEDDPAVAKAKELIKQKKADEALATLDAAQEANKENSEWFTTHGSIFLSKNQFQEAEKDLNRAIELNPKNAYAHYYMGMVQSRLKRTDQMVKHFEMFLQLAPNAPEAARVRSLLRTV